MASLHAVLQTHGRGLNDMQRKLACRPKFRIIIPAERPGLCTWNPRWKRSPLFERLHARRLNIKLARGYFVSVGRIPTRSRRGGEFALPRGIPPGDCLDGVGNIKRINGVWAPLIDDTAEIKGNVFQTIPNWGCTQNPISPFSVCTPRGWLTRARASLFACIHTHTHEALLFSTVGVPLAFAR